MYSGVCRHPVHRISVSYRWTSVLVMAGLIKPKNYDWKDSNLALFGSDTDKKVKKDSAKTEPAWKNAGTKAGLQIWRIVKFEVKEWPQKQYGSFFSGDSYIILNTYKPDPKSDELAYDVHFWIGSQSSQDEYGTAAYKTVELDTYLDDKPIQHREVQGHESDVFHTYFPKGITILDGGAETGFHHVTPDKYKPRLLKFEGVGKKVTVSEIPLVRSRLNSGDVFILDLGLQLYQWNGSKSSKDERFKAMQYLNDLKSERNGKADSEVLEEGGLDDKHAFYAALTGTEDGSSDSFHVTDPNPKKELYKMSDAGGSMAVSKVKEGKMSAADLDSKDVFILDTGKDCFVWVGKNASPDEKKNGLGYAHNHLIKTTHPLLSIVVIKEGQENNHFKTALAA